MGLGNELCGHDYENFIWSALKHIKNSRVGIVIDEMKGLDNKEIVPYVTLKDYIRNFLQSDLLDTYYNKMMSE